MSGHPCYAWTFAEAFWWGLMTITTVGKYGRPDHLPKPLTVTHTMSHNITELLYMDQSCLW